MEWKQDLMIALVCLSLGKQLDGSLELFWMAVGFLWISVMIINMIKSR